MTSIIKTQNRYTDARVDWKIKRGGEYMYSVGKEGRGGCKRGGLCHGGALLPGLVLLVVTTILLLAT